MHFIRRLALSSLLRRCRGNICTLSPVFRSCPQRRCADMIIKTHHPLHSDPFLSASRQRGSTIKQFLLGTRPRRDPEDRVGSISFCRTLLRGHKLQALKSSRRSTELKACYASCTGQGVKGKAFGFNAVFVSLYGFSQCIWLLSCRFMLLLVGVSAYS